MAVNGERSLQWKLKLRIKSHTKIFYFVYFSLILLNEDNNYKISELCGVLSASGKADTKTDGSYTQVRSR